MFRLLGLAAALNLGLNRIRFNLVPLNYAIAALLLWGATSGLTRVIEGPADAEPQPVTVADLAAGRVPSGSFVRVSGFIEPGVILELGKRGTDGKLQDVRERLRLLHEGGPVAVWLRPVAVPSAVWTRATFVGMVRPLPTAAWNATTREGGSIGGRVPTPDCLIEDGARPQTYLTGVVRLTMCTPPLLLLAWIWVKRNHIFRPGQHVRAIEGNPHDAIDLRVSARLRPTRGTTRRFIEMDAHLGRLPDGSMVVLANIDASTYFMGWRVINREGQWTVTIPAGAALSVVAGELAFGRGVRPAARIDVRVNGRVINKLTLSFGSLNQRDRVLHALHATFASHPHAAAA
jgi:hypothetical protein